MRFATVCLLRRPVEAAIRQARRPSRMEDPLSRTMVPWLALLFVPTCLHAQLPPGWGELCGSAEARRFDFLVGDWEGIEYRIQSGDTVAVGRREYRIQPELDECALLERLDVWEGDVPTLRALLFRSLDRRTGDWALTRLDNGPTQRAFTPHETEGTVYFVSSYPEGDQTVMVRLGWFPTLEGVRQTLEESRDGGRSWIVIEFIEFRERGGGP